MNLLKSVRSFALLLLVCAFMGATVLTSCNQQKAAEEDHSEHPADEAEHPTDEAEHPTNESDTTKVQEQ